MANEGRVRGRIDKKESSLLFREITPPHGWSEDENNHYLRITLPGFKQPDVILQLDKYGHLVVRGERQLSGHKYLSFHETFELPKNANVEDASGEFQDGEIFCVTIPKLPKSSTIVGDRKSMGKNELKHDNISNDHSNRGNRTTAGSRKFGEILDLEVPERGRGGKNALDIIKRDERSMMKICFYIAIVVIVIVAIVLPVSLKLHKFYGSS